MVDRLESLLARFPVSGRVLHAHPLQGTYRPAGATEHALLHLIRGGPASATHGNGAVLPLHEPSLLLYPRPVPHTLHADRDSHAQVISAQLHFDGGEGSPVADALPLPVHLPLRALWGSDALLDLLFEETPAQRCGRQALLDSLLQALLVQLLRTLMENGQIQIGLLAGMGHPRLRHALVAMHEQPAHDWSLQALAERAGMSRSAFAETFREVIGSTPGHYLQGWRTRLVQQALRRGQPLKRIATEVGYGSEAALSRAFKAQTGHSPRQWKQRMAVPATSPSP